MTSSERPESSSAALTASILLALSLSLGVVAAVWFTLPNLIGFSGQNVLTEPDFWCVAGSFGCAVAASVVSFRFAFAGERPTGGALLGGAIFALGLAFLMLLLWGRYLLYYALLLAPVHALALLGVVSSWRRQRRDAALRRSGFGSSGSK